MTIVKGVITNRVLVEIINHVPTVRLILNDNKVYEAEGSIAVELYQKKHKNAYCILEVERINGKWGRDRQKTPDRFMINRVIA